MANIRELLNESSLTIWMILIIGGVLLFAIWSLSNGKIFEKYMNEDEKEGILIGANWLLPLGIVVVIGVFGWNMWRSSRS